jgi:hypothetical protein
MPANFCISQLPSKINSWLTSLLRQLPVSKQLREQHTMTGLKLGSGGGNIASPSDATTLISTCSVRLSKILCWELLPWLSGKAGSREIVLNHWLKAQSKVPTHMWYRPFWELVQQNPTKDTDNMLSILLSQQFRAYCNSNPKQVQQKALPFAVLNELAKRQVTDLDKAIVQLTISAAFFACCSCKYSNVSRREMKRTKLLCLRSIRFFKDGRLLLASSDNLEFAGSVV